MSGAQVAPPDPWRLALFADPARTMRALDKQYRVPRHIDYISQRLAAEVLRGGARLIVQIPPRHGKSKLCSVATPSWFLGLWPDRNVALVGYEEDFAIGWGRQVKHVAEEHPELGVELTNDSTAAGRWNTRQGGGMFCTGIGGPLLGRGFHLGIIDDPIKNEIEARSETTQRRNWEWWVTTFRTRAEPGASIVIIMQRWDENDLVGRLLAEMNAGTGENWTLISLPAECEEEEDEIGRKRGEPLWPERYDAAALAIFKRDPYWWAAQFQQRPAPLEGGLFKLLDLKLCLREASEVAPAEVAEGRYWDKAATRQEADASRYPMTAGVRGGIGYDGSKWITDCVTAQLDPPEVERLIRAVAERDGTHVPIFIEQEPGSAGKDVISHYQRNVLRGFSVVGHAPGVDKLTRAYPVATEVRTHALRIVRADWNEQYFRNFGLFPNGAQKDEIDATSGLFACMAEHGFRFSKPNQPAPRPRVAPSVSDRDPDWDALDRKTPSRGNPLAALGMGEGKAPW